MGMFLFQAVYDLSCIPEALLDYVADINTDKKDEEDSADSDSDGTIY